jgi:hypothetical protein
MSAVLDEINPQAVELVPFTRETLAPLETLAQAEIVTLTSLDLSAEISYAAFESIGAMLGVFDRATKWWIGDWLMYGEDRFTATRRRRSPASPSRRSCSGSPPLRRSRRGAGGTS